MGQTQLNITQLKTPDTCHVQKNAAGSAQTISNNTATFVTFDSEVVDTNSMHDNSTNNSRITIKKAGTYLIVGAIRWDSASAGGYSRQVYIYKNGSETFAQAMEPFATTSFPSQLITGILVLAVNDYIQLAVFQDSGGNLDIAKWNPNTYLQCIQLA